MKFLATPLVGSMGPNTADTPVLEWKWSSIYMRSQHCTWQTACRVGGGGAFIFFRCAAGGGERPPTWKIKGAHRLLGRAMMAEAVLSLIPGITCSPALLLPDALC